MPNLNGRWPIWYPIVGSPLIPFEDNFLQMAQSVANALDGYDLPLSVANNAARDSLFPSPTDGDRVYVRDTKQTQVYEGGWVIETSDWISYTPTWTAANSAPVLNNGTLLGRYKYIGRKLIAFRIELFFGNTTSGGAGDYAFALPLQAAPSGQQIVPCWVSLAGPGWDFTGLGLVSPGGTTIQPRVVESISSTVMKAARNANSGGGNNSGIPLVPSNYSYLAGSRVVIEGVFEIA
ncbi:MAG: hypothetical protein K0S70_110 [Microbacterium sp.]|jgi:hypothetical protein|nr:hypothetical protein [Microbacterium sp.]